MQPTSQLTCEICCGTQFDPVPNTDPRLFACQHCRLVIYPKPTPVIGRVAKGGAPDLSTGWGAPIERK